MLNVNLDVLYVQLSRNALWDCFAIISHISRYILINTKLLYLKSCSYFWGDKIILLYKTKKEAKLSSAHIALNVSSFPRACCDYAGVEYVHLQIVPALWAVPISHVPTRRTFPAMRFCGCGLESGSAQDQPLRDSLQWLRKSSSRGGTFLSRS